VLSRQRHGTRRIAQGTSQPRCLANKRPRCPCRNQQV
jgi:hypothetical protein